MCIDDPRRRKIRRIKRLTIHLGPTREHIHSRLQAPTASRFRARAKRIAQRHEVNIIIIRRSGVQSRVDKAVLLRRGVPQAGRAVHGLIGNQIAICTFDDGVAVVVVFATVFIFEEVGGQIGHDGGALVCILGAGGVEDAGDGGVGSEGVEEGV